MWEGLRQLDGPYEILELGDGEVKDLRIENYSVGTVTIYPPWRPQGKIVRALRVHVPESEKQFSPYYWDITGQTLIYQLLPHLEAGDYKSKVFRVTKHGIAPKARFTLQVVPT